MLFIFIFLIPFVSTNEMRPNFVFILADDLDLNLNSVNSMKNAWKLIANAGLTFSNAYVNSPLCCPSRSSILTGNMPRTLQVFNNSLNGGCASRQFRLKHEPRSVSALLHQAGYKTMYAGKYLNQYGAQNTLKHVPKGYDWWMGLKGNSKYYNYTLSLNGTSKQFEHTYFTDQITEFALNFLENAKNDSFFMFLSPPAAHAPFTPAPRHANMFKNRVAPRSAPFNCSAANKHWLVRMPPVFLPESVQILDEIYRNRLRTLQAVDEMIGRLIAKLGDMGLMDNTFVVFTSDNGYHIGQFGMPWDKRQPYEFDVKVPFFMRGPRLAAKQVVEYPISGIDFAPTVLDLAGVKSGKMDGESFKRHLLNWEGKEYEKSVRIEYWGEANQKSVDKRCNYSINSELSQCSLESWCKCQDSRNNTYSCLVHLSSGAKWKVCDFIDGFREVYNLQIDPNELNNLFEN